MNNSPKDIFTFYEKEKTHKSALGLRGIYDQAKMNERFFIGDQWHGINVGKNRPLVRNNVIKRIGELKLATVNNPVSVCFSADGIPLSKENAEKIRAIKSTMPNDISALASGDEINLVMSALGDYFKSTSERLNFEKIRTDALKDAYISGTGIIYTYWDEETKTGLYLDEAKKTEITGDIKAEVLSVENVYFGDHQNEDIETQPFIIIAQKLPLREIKSTAQKFGKRVNPVPDDTSEDKATVLTMLYKKQTENGSFVHAVKVTKNEIIYPETNLGITVYPLAKYTFLRRKNSPYGESEITYLIPNQIAINRMISASSWATMIMGMPIMMVNRDVIRGNISNDPGQIINVSGTGEEINTAIKYVTPPQFNANFENSALSLASATLNMAGANDAALGDISPNNTSAIIAVREAAMLPMENLKNSYFNFIESIARIWAEFWIRKYGNRSLKISDENGTWYMPFHSARYNNLLINARVDVASSTIIGDAETVETLSNLYDRGIITKTQFLKRLPAGTVPDLGGILREIKETEEAEESAFPTPEYFEEESE